MSTYRRYQEARDAAWRALLRFRVNTLPVDMQAVLEELGVTLLPFPNPGEEPRLSALIAKTGAKKCLSLRIGGEWRVFFQPGACTENELRFSLAHELGHLATRRRSLMIFRIMRRIFSPCGCWPPPACCMRCGRIRRAKSPRCAGCRPGPPGFATSEWPCSTSGTHSFLIPWSGR